MAINAYGVIQPVIRKKLIGLKNILVYAIYKQHNY